MYPKHNCVICTSFYVYAHHGNPVRAHNFATLQPSSKKGKHYPQCTPAWKLLLSESVFSRKCTIACLQQQEPVIGKLRGTFLLCACGQPVINGLIDCQTTARCDTCCYTGMEKRQEQQCQGCSVPAVLMGPKSAQVSSAVDGSAPPAWLGRVPTCTGGYFHQTKTMLTSLSGCRMQCWCYQCQSVINSWIKWILHLLLMALMPILTQETYVHLPIFFTAYAVQDLGELEAIPADFRVRGVVHLGQAASPPQPDSNTLPHTHLWPIYTHPEDTHVVTEGAQLTLGTCRLCCPSPETQRWIALHMLTVKADWFTRSANWVSRSDKLVKEYFAKQVWFLWYNPNFFILSFFQNKAIEPIYDLSFQSKKQQNKPCIKDKSCTTNTILFLNLYPSLYCGVFVPFLKISNLHH